eukprot:560464-Rhodomonas_salina.1
MPVPGSTRRAIAQSCVSVPGSTRRAIAGRRPGPRESIGVVLSSLAEQYTLRQNRTWRRLIAECRPRVPRCVSAFYLLKSIADLSTGHSVASE